MWFLTISDPGDGSGYWIRYTIRAPISGPPEARVWFAAFAADEGATPVALNEGLPVGRLHIRNDPFEARMGDSVIRSDRAVGSIEGHGHRVAWDLTFRQGPTFRLLPPAMYRGPLAPTKPLTPNPDARFDGAIEVDGDRRILQRAPGQQGHLFGTRHAERWAWAYCSAFEGDGRVFQALSAQVRRASLLTPFLTVAGLRIDGEWIRLRGLSRRRDWDLGRWRLALMGRRHRLEGEVRAAPRSMVQARYLDPDDTPRWCHHSEVASCRLTLWERRPGGWHEVAELASTGTTHAEWTGRTPAPGVEAAHQELP